MMIILKIVILKLLIMLDIWLGTINFKQKKNIKIIHEKLMLAALHPTRWLD